MNFYFEASNILDRLDAKQGSIKGLLSTLPPKNRARTAALVIETLKYKAVLSDVITASKLLAQEKKITSLNLALVLVHDVLLSGGIQAGDGPIKQAALRHKTRLRSELQRIKIKRGVKSDRDLAQPEDERAVRIPRYVRVNTLLWTTDEAIRHYQKEGFQLSDPFSAEKSFSRDQHVPDLLLFNPRVQFHHDVHYKMGKIILQDKASCFPAIVLAPPRDDHAVVIDATAAPGNKTSHLSALMSGNGKLYAFERDKKRFSTLKTMLSKASCKNAEAIHVDFLNVDPLEPKYANTTHILLDPSCSGSGIVNRLDHLLDSEHEQDEEQEERLNRLATFQLMVIKHAMKCRSEHFCVEKSSTLIPIAVPHVRKIVYSTCSIHVVENERVVCAALKSEEAERRNFKLASPGKVLPTWHRRGQPDELESSGKVCVVTHSLDKSDFTPKKRERDEEPQSRRKKRKAGSINKD
ncbi:S-adenosyl-L-methionine-dependent methyltransferase [Chiua virens]|nr:S-adenosyl-L-methionine-dependent methyltransferase [Chiua virens]